MAENLYDKFLVHPDGRFVIAGLENSDMRKGLPPSQSQLQAIRDVSMLGLDPLTYDHQDLNPMDQAAWEAQQAALEAAGYPSMPKIPGTNTGGNKPVPAKPAKAKSLLDLLVGGLTGGGGLPPPIRTDGTSRTGLNNSIAIRPQDRGNANYVEQARQNAEIKGSGSDGGPTERRSRMLGFKKTSAYESAFKSWLAENGYDPKMDFHRNQAAFDAFAKSLGKGPSYTSGRSSNGTPTRSTPIPKPNTPTTAGPIISPMADMSKPSIDKRNMELNNVVAGMILSALLPGTK